MVPLLLATLCSASIALIFKRSEAAGLNRYAVTSANYLAASAVSLITLAAGGWPRASEVASRASWAEIGSLLAGSGATPSPAASLTWGVLVGMSAGAVFFLAFIYYQVSVRRHGVGLSGTFAKLGILVPMLGSLALWREWPQGPQWAGMGLAAVAILLVHWPARGGAPRAALLLLFLLGGAAEFSNKVFQKYAAVDHKSVFLFVTFTVALALSLVATWRKRRPVTVRDGLTGLAVGVPNLFSSFFLILALDHLPAAVVFPAYGAGSIVIINLAGAALFGERLSRREWCAIALTVIALVLIST